MKKLILILALFTLAIIASGSLFAFKPSSKFEKETVKLLQKEIISRADKVLTEVPQTITMYVCSRSAGGIHDFYSEGDYWWPDPANPDGPYIQHDGMTNPDNLVDHRKAMIRLSQIVGSLASAYKITGDEKYVRQAFIHLKAWLVDPSTRMNPSLLYSQAIKGRFTGREIGIIDTIQLMEVAQGITASALYELSTYSTQKKYYIAIADKIVTSLTKSYRSPIGENRGFILKHSTGSKPANSKVDVPLNYADYYYLEALLRSEKLTGKNK